MTYDLGIDLGTTYTAAAVLRDGGTHPETVALGSRLAVVPSVVHRAADGTVLVGESAERRAADEPDRVVREVKRRLGDDVPPVVGGEPWPAEEVAAAIVAWVLARVAEREGGPARHVVVTHPATWGDFRCSRLRAALTAAGLDTVELLAEPHAAVLGHAALRRSGGDAGSTTAVYDLGGGTFDAAVARRAADGTVTLLGTPRGLDRVGGVDFDEAVLAHVRAEVADALAGLDPDDPESWHALHRLRRECVEAKEALSADTEVTVPVVLPAGHRSVRLSRADFEARIRESVAATVEEFVATLADAGLAPAEVDHVLLAGGSSSIPLVARMLTEALGRPVAADADPLTVVALGAAVAARGTSSAATDEEPAAAPAGPQRPPTAVVGPFAVPDDEDVPPRRRGRRLLAASVVVAAAVTVAVSVPLPLDDAVGDSLRTALRDTFSPPAAALTVPPAPAPTVPPTVVARPLGEVTPLGPTGAAVTGAAAGPGLVPPPGTGPA
ncbi:Hsp70 family protein, partial [Actinomycetospora chlora]|uniref:Hsp70 family protein n=1 Tax=Actinomycetospora chlora TaxID=663608 RepID=UPI0031ECE40E